MKLRIAQIAPLWENIPPAFYGGTERVVYSLTEGLVQKGHDVTMFACGTSQTSAKLVSVYPRPLFRDNIPWTNVTYPMLNITEAFDHHNDFDIIHMHLNKPSDFLALPLSENIKHKVVFTLHFPYPYNRPGYEDRAVVLQKYTNFNYISISNAARLGGANLKWIATVYNGIETKDFTFQPKPDKYWLWLGGFKQTKGTNLAIQAAKKAGVHLKLAGKIDSLEGKDFDYYNEKVKPFIDGKQIEYVGEVGGKEKDQLFGGAVGFLNPIEWNEPFGLVMVESMAAGTPVISYRNGAALELIKDKETGFLVESVDQMAERIKDIDSINREKCRQHVEKNFSAPKMTEDYEKVYLKTSQQYTQ